MLEDNWASVREQFARESDDLSTNLAERGLEIAKEHAPVDTGRLRDSLHTEHVGSGETDIVTDVEYAEPQEYGSERNPAHPYMTPAAVYTTQEVDSIAGRTYTL